MALFLVISYKCFLLIPIFFKLLRIIKNRNYHALLEEKHILVALKYISASAPSRSTLGYKRMNRAATVRE